METEISFFEWSFKGLVTIVLGIGAWLWINLVGKVDKMDDDHTEFKLNVVENYAKDATLQSTLERIHGRIDVMSEDIKTLIAKSASHG